MEQTKLSRINKIFLWKKEQTLTWQIRHLTCTYPIWVPRTAPHGFPRNDWCLSTEPGRLPGREKVGDAGHAVTQDVWTGRVKARAEPRGEGSCWPWLAAPWLRISQTLRTPLPRLPSLSLCAEAPHSRAPSRKQQLKLGQRLKFNHHGNIPGSHCSL